MNLEGKIRLEIADVTDWTDISSPYLDNPLSFQPTDYTWVDVTEGLISATITRGVTKYEGPWSQIAPGQLSIVSRNPILDPTLNQTLAAYGHKVRIFANDTMIYSGKIRDVQVEYSNEYDPQIITIEVFDALQQLVDFAYDNVELVQGLNDTEPLPKTETVNMGTIWKRFGIGPNFRWSLNGGVVDWQVASKVNFGYQRDPYPLPGGGDYDGYLPYAAGYAPVDQYDAATENLRQSQEWHPRVFIDPWNFNGWGSSKIRNIPTNLTGEAEVTGVIAPASFDDGYFGGIDTAGNIIPQGRAWDIRHGSLIDSTRFGLGDPKHPLYLDNNANPSNPQFTEGLDVPSDVSEATINTGDGTLVGANESRRTWNGGFVAGVTDANTNLVDMLLAMEQSEQGFMYVTAKDDMWVLNRRQVHYAERGKHLRFASDGTGTSYKGIKVSDGVQNIVNKLVINNTTYDKTQTVTSEYNNVNHRAFDTNEEIRLINAPGSPNSIYEFDVPKRNIETISVETFTFVDEESVKRYGERELQLNTNYAFGLEETYGDQQNDVTWYGNYVNYDIPSGDQYLDPRDGTGTQSRWRFFKMERYDDNQMRATVWNTSRSSQYTGQGDEEIYNRNAVARANELKTIIIDNYATPSNEIQSISWEPKTNADITNASYTDIFDKIDIDHNVNGVTFDKEYRVMGITHRITLDSWNIEYQLWNQQGQP